MTTIYLAHPGKPSVMRTAKKLQKKLEDLGFQVFNPFDYSQFECSLKTEWDNGQRTETCFKIFDNDLGKVNKSDILVAYVPQVFTAGTMMEIYHAFLQGKLVYIYSKIRSPWLIVPSGDKVYNEFDKLLGELKKYV